MFKPANVDLLCSITVLVIMFVAKRCCVSGHYGFEPLLPEGPVIGAANARKMPRQGQSTVPHRRLRFQAKGYLVQQRSRPSVSDQRDEIATLRQKKPPIREPLRPDLVRVTAERFE